jgi:hypothetical protein
MAYIRMTCERNVRKHVDLFFDPLSVRASRYLHNQRDITNLFGLRLEVVVTR